MIRFGVLNKREKEIWLPVLFDLFYENMHHIAPSGLCYEQEKQQWLQEISPALDKDPRKIVLCFDNDAVVGYVQYYTNRNLLMIEEVQIKKSHQQTTLFYGICKHLAWVLPEEIETIEAYAEKRNLHSQKIMEKLGMVQIDEEGPFVHLRGSAKSLHRHFK
jgi:RimJ/RimL family protein N-acetyltransferase